jgi:hypothetical protein
MRNTQSSRSGRRGRTRPAPRPVDLRHAPRLGRARRHSPRRGARPTANPGPNQRSACGSVQRPAPRVQSRVPVDGSVACRAPALQPTCCAISAFASAGWACTRAAPQHQRRDDGRVGLDDEHRRVLGELVPGDLLVRRGARVRAVRRRRVADLAEVGPGLHRLLQVVLDRRHDADREVAGDAAADLEEADAGALRRAPCTGRRRRPCTRCPT